MFSWSAAVYTGQDPLPDVFSTAEQMTVILLTDESVTKKGFLANFTTGYRLGKHINPLFLSGYTAGPHGEWRGTLSP